VRNDADPVLVAIRALREEMVNRFREIEVFVAKLEIRICDLEKRVDELDRGKR
jgi:hypothetical protein